MTRKRQPKGTAGSKGGQFASGERAKETTIGTGTLTLTPTEEPSEIKPKPTSETSAPPLGTPIRKKDGSLIRAEYIPPMRMKRLSSENSWFRVGDLIINDTSKQHEFNEYILGYMTEKLLHNHEWLLAVTIDAIDKEDIAEKIDTAFDVERESVLDALSKDKATRNSLAEVTTQQWTCGQQLRFFEITAKAYEMALEDRPLTSRLRCMGCNVEVDTNCIRRGGGRYCHQRCIKAANAIEDEIKEETAMMKANLDVPLASIRGEDEEPDGDVDDTELPEDTDAKRNKLKRLIGKD